MNKNLRSIKKVSLLPLLIVFVLTLVGSGQEILAGDSFRSVQPVLTTDDLKKEMGSSEIVRYEDRIFMMLRTTGLEPGTVATMWFVVFNSPENCTDPCNADDVKNPEVGFDLFFADVVVIRDSGEAIYVAEHKVGDASGSIVTPFLGTPTWGLKDAFKPEIHLVVRTHGPLIPDLIQEMVSTFNAGCGDQSPELGVPGPNSCSNIQVSIYKPSQEMVSK